MQNNVVIKGLAVMLIGLTQCEMPVLQAQHQAQGPVNVYRSTIGDSLFIYGDNKAVIPYQVKVSLSISDGITKSDALYEATTYQVINPQSTGSIILGAYRGREHQYRYQYYYLPGNPEMAAHDDEAVYFLPYQEGERYRVMQGYMGRHSHRNEYMLDFDMPENTPVHASRGGIVFDVKNDSDKGGGDRSFFDDANYIHIMHGDGSFAQYYHLRKNGTTVEVGDTVRAGQLIGYSGNTGFSTHPHLHFTVRVPVNMDTKTVPTRFKLGPNRTGQPRQGRRYRSYH